MQYYLRPLLSFNYHAAQGGCRMLLKSYANAACRNISQLWMKRLQRHFALTWKYLKTFRRATSAPANKNPYLKTLMPNRREANNKCNASLRELLGRGWSLESSKPRAHIGKNYIRNYCCSHHDLGARAWACADVRPFFTHSVSLVAGAARNLLIRKRPPRLRAQEIKQATDARLPRRCHDNEPRVIDFVSKHSLLIYTPAVFKDIEYFTPAKSGEK